jgi:hypothetical protein
MVYQEAKPTARSKSKHKNPQNNNIVCNQGLKCTINTDLIREKRACSSKLYLYIQVPHDAHDSLEVWKLLGHIHHKKGSLCLKTSSKQVSPL